jgi:hypothetical protein
VPFIAPSLGRTLASITARVTKHFALFQFEELGAALRDDGDNFLPHDLRLEIRNTL